MIVRIHCVGGGSGRNPSPLVPWDNMVEAAGIEPVRTVNLNLMMVHDFGFYDMKTFELPRRYLSP